MARLSFASSHSPESPQWPGEVPEGWCAPFSRAALLPALEITCKRRGDEALSMGALRARPLSPRRCPAARELRLKVAEQLVAHFSISNHEKEPSYNMFPFAGQSANLLCIVL